MKSLNPTGRSFLLVIILFLFMVSLTGVGFAQTLPPGIMTMITSELQKRGLTESEVRVRLMQEGIDPEKIPPAELPQYQTRVLSILDELQNEKKDKSGVSSAGSIGKGLTDNLGKDSTGQVGSRKVRVTPMTTPEEAAAEATQRVILAAVAKEEGSKGIYGHAIFRDRTLDVFRTTDGAQAPETYVLGDGDEIRITIFGASQTDLQLRIDADGSIQPAGVAKIFLKGLTLAQAREVIRSRLSAAYTFRYDQLAVTIVTARTIMVNVYGEVNITGGFNISALNSALNALSAAGGPTEIGSVRNIRLIRGNTSKNIDVYAFMNDPANQYKYDLQNNDILFVPVAKLVVSMEGAIKRPMMYEMLPDETLADLIRYAGDVDMNVYPDFVQIQRYINGEQRLLEYNLAEVRAGKIRVELMNGDVVRIKAIG
ncbi:MAG TPA: polysaccharide biosynthesis/export family protein, partial [Prolixibacteraceae bacterium]|nr:polysaccharide biosynthesis/export family protein [Prolixibacteraceae bacterium]